jgi:nitrite reductase (cytochrome c-552)
VPYPDNTTKAKAQPYIGLDMAKLNAGKEIFKTTTLFDWMNKAKEREAKY